MGLIVSCQGKMATADEIRIAHEIMKAVRRLQLPLKLDEITEGRGNCFPLSVMAQCRRQEIFHHLNTPIKNLAQQGDPTLLRRAIYAFMENSRNQTIQEYKRRYQEILASLDNRTWREYWKVMVRDYEWVDYIFIQSAAWFLGHDIIIVTTTSTEDHPYITISGNLGNEKMSCPGIPLTIGSKSNVHFQSLLPLEVRVPRNKIEPRSPENTINLKMSTKISSEQNEDPGPDLNSKVEFPELKPSRPRRQVQPINIPRSNKLQKSSGQANPIEVNINKGQRKNNSDLGNENTESCKQKNENKIFKYEQDGIILNFQFISDKRVKCPICRNEFKNILRHLQKSGCQITNQVDFSERFKHFAEIHQDENQVKDNQNKRKAKSRAKQREDDGEQVKNAQNGWKAKIHC